MVKYTVITTNPQLIANGETIIVTKIIISSNFAPQTVNFYERDGTTLIMVLIVRAPSDASNMGQNFEFTTEFVAHKGLKVAGAGCTVFYSQGAA